MGKGGMMKFCDALCRRVTVITDTEIMRLERKPGTHLYTLFKRVRAEVSLRGAAALDSSVLSRPLELACGSFEAVICCLPPAPACALMQHVSHVTSRHCSAVAELQFCIRCALSRRLA